VRNFEVTDEQWEQFEQWSEKQIEKDNYLPTAGERFTFCFTLTGLGDILVVRDEYLNEEINLTDFDNW